jgi:hypothetical protein
LLGWLFGRLVGKKDQEDLALSREELTQAVGALEGRVTAIETPEGKRGKTGNVVRLPPFAAE